MAVTMEKNNIPFVPQKFFQINIEENSLSIFVQGVEFSTKLFKNIKHDSNIDLYKILTEEELTQFLTPNCFININILTNENINLKIKNLRNLHLIFEEQNIGSSLYLENLENTFIKTFKKNSIDYFELIKIQKCNNLVLWIPNQRNNWQNKLEILNSSNINVLETDFSLVEIVNCKDIKINNSEIDSFNCINNKEIEILYNDITNFYSYNNTNLSFFHNEKLNNIVMLKNVLRGCIIEGKNITIQNTTTKAIEILNIPANISIENLDLDNWLKIYLTKTDIGLFLEKIVEGNYLLKNIDILKLVFKNEIEMEISNTLNDKIFKNLSNILKSFSHNKIDKEELKNEIIKWYINNIKYIIDNNIYIPNFIKENAEWKMFLKKGRYMINKI